MSWTSRRLPLAHIEENGQRDNAVRLLERRLHRRVFQVAMQKAHFACVADAADDVLAAVHRLAAPVKLETIQMILLVAENRGAKIVRAAVWIFDAYARAEIANRRLRRLVVIEAANERRRHFDVAPVSTFARLPKRRVFKRRVVRSRRRQNVDGRLLSANILEAKEAFGGKSCKPTLNEASKWAAHIEHSGHSCL